MKTQKLVEKTLQKLLDEYGVSKELTIKMIKDWILNDEGELATDASNRFQKKWFKYFSRVEDINELNEILQKFFDAWNYFPHKSLNGKSPYQMIGQAAKKAPASAKEGGQKMPDMIVGGHKMPWDEYWEMIKEMERLQIPFKDWVEKELLPKYEKFLGQTAEANTLEKHKMVADIFFKRVLHIGFIEFEQIRKDFIQKEFPKWWQTHVLMSSLSEQEVLSSLKKLFEFIASAYDSDIKKFGF